MDDRDKRPRHYAVDLTAAWVRGGSPADELARIPPQWRDQASTHARAYCQQIAFHRRAGTPLEQIKGRQIAEWVQEYSARVGTK